ncbi:MAG: BlaI/MecI/CopY family transcriptional regulator [Marinicaulis sp.]|nr:BlaI/MecI/CopY family transcriptional regulator [Marinicaulis sp.]NNE41257.1 BlaI/MecI/CopY family transcriptional regulator [Marinicaulis sp.]NNL89826.1 BlaI/MecI/CopY family transcriptional regulator [Marinicaulis sp.]
MTDQNYNNPTRPELAILKLLWREKTLSARDIHHQIADEFNWTYSTVRTVLERMIDKGLVDKESVKGANIYSAEVGKVSLLGRMIKDFSSRVLELDSAPATAFFSDSKLLSEDELEQLESVLRKWENEE